MKSAVALCGVALLFALPAAAGRDVHGSFTYSLTVKAKPEAVHGITRGLVTGSARGTFFVQGHHPDRDRVVWNMHRVRGTLMLYQGGKLLARMKLTTGVGYEPDGSNFRSVGFKGTLLGSRFRCAKPKAFLTLDDINRGPGNTDSFQFGACGSYADWRGAPAKVSISVKHR